MSGLIQIIFAISERPELLTRHASAIHDLLAEDKERHHETDEVVMGFSRKSKSQSIQKSEKIQKATSFLLDCGILNREEIGSGALSYEAKDKFIELYSSYNSDELNEALSSDFLKTLSVAQPTAPGSLTDNEKRLTPIFEGELGRLATAKALKALMGDKNLSIRKVAEIAKVQPKEVQRILGGEASIDKAAAVLRDLGCDLQIQIHLPEPE